MSKLDDNHLTFLEGAIRLNINSGHTEMAVSPEELRELIAGCRRAQAAEAARDEAVEALEKIGRWRQDCHAHDADMDHELRSFDQEDWDIVEAFARTIVEKYGRKG